MANNKNKEKISVSEQNLNYGIKFHNSYHFLRSLLITQEYMLIRDNLMAANNGRYLAILDFGIWLATFT